jgi:hypothetical protein
VVGQAVDEIRAIVEMHSHVCDDDYPIVPGHNPLQHILGSHKAPKAISAGKERQSDVIHGHRQQVLGQKHGPSQAPVVVCRYFRKDVLSDGSEVLLVVVCLLLYEISEIVSTKGYHQSKAEQSRAEINWWHCIATFKPVAGYKPYKDAIQR